MRYPETAGIRPVMGEAIRQLPAVRAVSGVVLKHRGKANMVPLDAKIRTLQNRFLHAIKRALDRTQETFVLAAVVPRITRGAKGVFIEFHQNPRHVCSRPALPSTVGPIPETFILRQPAIAA